MEKQIKIWKNPLYHTSGLTFEVELPESSNVINIDMQEGELYAWAEVDADCESLPSIKKEYLVVPTGAVFSKGNAKFIKTIQTPTYGFVYHIYDKVA